MKIKNGFILREVAGSYVVVAINDAAKSFNGMVNLNETGAFLWKLLECGAERDKLVESVLERYDTDAKTAETDIDAFLSPLIKAGIVE